MLAGFRLRYLEGCAHVAGRCCCLLIGTVVLMCVSGCFGTFVKSGGISVLLGDREYWYWSVSGRT